MTERGAASARRLAVAGVVAGLAAVAVLGAMSIVFGGPEPLTLALGQAAVLVATAGPFLLSAVALAVPRGDIQAGVWLAAGSVAAIVSVLLSISGVSLILLPGAALLLAGGIRAVREVSEAGRLVGLVALGVVVLTLMSGLAWGTMTEARCWYRAGDQWVQRPFSNSIVIEEPFTMGVCGSGPTAAGAAISMGVWAVAAASLAATRRWLSRALTPA